MGDLVETFRAHNGDLSRLLAHIRRLDGGQGWSAGRRRTAEAVGIMKASTFIVAYNAVEQSYRAAITLCRTTVASSGLKYHQASEHWRRDLIDGSVSPKMRAFEPPSAIIAHLDEVVLRAGRDSTWKFNSKAKSNNVDNVVLRELLRSIGVQFKAPKRSRDGVELQTIKEKRNALAHGEERFSDVGSDYSTAQLTEMFGRTRLYVEAAMRATERYVRDRGFVAVTDDPHMLSGRVGTRPVP